MLASDAVQQGVWPIKMCDFKDVTDVNVLWTLITGQGRSVYPSLDCA